MRRGEVWWADMPPRAGRRSVVLLSRDEAYGVRDLVTVAPVTTRVRGIAVEVSLGPREGLPRPCVVNLDTIRTIPKARLTERAGFLSDQGMTAVDAAIRFALRLDAATP